MKLEEMHAAILATPPGRPGPVVGMGFALELIERVLALEATVERLAELAKGH